MTHVLFLGAGRRVQLGEMFRQRGCVISGYELDERVPLKSIAPIFVGKKWNDPDLEKDLRELIVGHAIDLLIPLDCRGVHALSRLNLPAPAPVAPEQATLPSLDKAEFEKCAAGFADLFPFACEGFPAVKKPRRGFGSNGIEFVDRFSAAEAARFPDCIYQRRCFGDEYSVDAYWNRTGEFVGASPRKRLRIAGGEVLDSVTVKRPDLVDAARRIGNSLGLIGPSCIQFIEQEGRPYVMEVNARFGGGSTLSIAAGLDMIDYALREYVRGEKVPAGSGWASPNVLMTRSYTDHIFKY